MNQINEAYIGLDFHANKSVFGMIDQHGHKQKRQRVETDPAALKEWRGEVRADRTQLAIEEGPLTQWIGWQLSSSVDELIACDPKQNFLISRSSRKSDGLDAMKLARLLRLGELAPGWHPEAKNKRALFASAAAHYLSMRAHQVRLTLQIKALFRRWGILEVQGEAIYSAEGRTAYLQDLDDGQIRRQLRS